MRVCKIAFLIMLMSWGYNSYSQENTMPVDSSYLEDQLYLSVGYNILAKKPLAMAQNGFSLGFSSGFIKDIPLNEKRNAGLGIGLGYVHALYVQNLHIEKGSSAEHFSIASGFDVNRLRTSAIEMPLEIRFRGSAPELYKFWRVYGGINISYIISSKATHLAGEEKVLVRPVNSIKKWQYGLTMAAGYDSWNLYLYYALTPLFENASLDGEKIEVRALHLGFKIYIM